MSVGDPLECTLAAKPGVPWNHGGRPLRRTECEEICTKRDLLLHDFAALKGHPGSSRPDEITYCSQTCKLEKENVPKSAICRQTRLRSRVLNREIALNVAVVFAIPAAVVWWIDRVQRISVA